MSNRSNRAANWVIVVVGVLLAALVLSSALVSLSNSVSAHDEHDGVMDPDQINHIHYAENRTDPVRDFDSTDPEGARIEWNVRGVDAADFEIDSAGVLTFRESPDYENPTDRGLDLNPSATTDPVVFTDADEFAPNNNNYQIMVSATEMSAAVPAKRTDIVLTVVVDNADDTGELTLQWLQPEVGTPITATLTDPDGGITTGPSDWTWYTSKVADPEVGTDFHWNEVDDDLVTQATTVSSYTPQGDNVDDPDDAAVDEGKHLRVKVEYGDAHSAGKTVSGVSMNPVRAQVSSPGDNGSPDFEEDADTRTVPESTDVGDPVGSPVAATDPDNDTLTYELIEVADPNDGDDEFFNIDQASGQIIVARELDYDAVGDRTEGATAGEYKVIVRATDPSGLADNIPVTITAENVNEDPIVTGQAELSVPELTGTVYVSLPDAPDVQPLGAGSRNYERNEYVFDEPDHLDSIADWQLEGDDAGAFDLSGRFEPRYLQFKEAPDYENPTDMNNDNVYEVTLVAMDTDPLGTGAGIGKVNVWLIVTNVEETGKVVFTAGETAYLNEMLVAEVQDPDDHSGDLGEPYQGVHIVNWQWSRALTDAAATFEEIADATTNTYTSRDMDRGYYLRATARYTDPLRTEDDPSTMGDERIAEGSLRTEMATTENAVRVAPGPESAPTFPDEAGTVTRRVAENTGPGGNVGAPVAAMAANTDETLTYTLEGTDAQYFNIDDMGQITVGGDDTSTRDVTEPGTDPELDYDNPAKPKMFHVTVKVDVTGGEANQNAQVDVNIIVTNVDEPPMITDKDVAEPPMTAIMYPEIDENGAPNTAAVATYVGTDSEGDSISWDLRGADAALFTIDGGVLKFREAPDYENPTDMAGANTATSGAGDTAADNNIYNIVIRAIASRTSDDTGPAETLDTTVVVTVTDVDEDGEVVISWLQPEVGIAIMASLTDPDGPSDAGPPPVTNTAITNAEWVWDVSEIVQGSLDVENDDHWGTAPGDRDETAASYTPDASDETKYLRVTASYTDRTGNTKTAWMMSANPVQAEGGGAENGSPDFVDEKVDRGVAETAAVGANVDTAITASVESTNSKDTLTYGLRTVIGDDLTSNLGVDLPSGTGTEPADDLAAFDIDKATGQITVAQKLNFESRGTPDDGKYVVVATVTDPSGLFDSVVVVITAGDKNEAPVLRGRPELTINEINSGEANADSPLFVGNTADADPTVNVYNVDDEDYRASVASWRLEGEDAGEFQLIGTVGRTLVFTTQPDYENPADANGDNVYKVTVVAIDNDGGRGEFDVCIAVMNVNEAGKVTLLNNDGVELVQPRAQGPITAELTDPDGGVTGVIWKWERSQLYPPFTAADITYPMSATYMPTNADTSYYLRVTATYMDAKNDADDVTARTAAVIAAFAVLEVEDLKRAPAFPQDATEVGVAENSPSTTYVGEAIVAAVDPDRGTNLTYTLEGDDAAHFELVPDTRQIRVKAPVLPVLVVGDDGNTYPTVDLNHEDDKKNSYEVEFKASDGALDDTIMVTITVTDRNEAPSVPMMAASSAPTPTNNAPEFAAATDTREVPENTGAGENIGAPVMATDADAGDTLTYTLGGADMASFDIDGAIGQLMTKAALDFDTKDSYTVEVMADDGNGGTDTITVTITVTDLADNAPEFPAAEDGARSVAENTAAGENIGAPVMATDTDAGDTLTYTLGGTDMVSFDIDGATGQLMTKAALDFDTKDSYTVEVMADDGNGGTDTITVTITVTEVPEGSALDLYDSNNSGEIEGPEVIQAVRDYFDGTIIGPQVIEVVKLYFAGRSN